MKKSYPKELCPTTKNIGNFYDKPKESSIEKPNARKEVKCPELKIPCCVGHHMSPFIRQTLFYFTEQTDLRDRDCVPDLKVSAWRAN